MKKVLKSLGIGLLIGVLLCGVAYGVLIFIYGDTDVAVLKPDGTEQNTEDENTENISTEKDEVIINSNAELIAAMTASDTLIPSKIEELFTITYPTMDHTNTQGGYSDGKYFYQAFYMPDNLVDQANNECIIVKYDMETNEVVKTSEVMQLNHVNDITYNDKLGHLVICHNAPFHNVISYVNPETLELIDTFAIDYYIYSLDYNAARDCYVAGLAGSKTFQLFNADFEAVSEVFNPTSRSNKSTTQGNASDDDYIYFVLYKPNIITVYDWDGNFVTLIELEEFFLSEDYEPENLSVVDGEIYVSLRHSGAAVFKLSDFVPQAVEEAE